MHYELRIYTGVDELGHIPDMKVEASSCKHSMEWPGFVEVVIEGEVSHLNLAYIKEIKEVNA